MDKLENDLVSIVIPVYNVEPYIDRCMRSVLSQSYSNLEIIMIDDGSTDKSGTICDEYASKDERIRVVHQENKGLSAARNIGTKASIGQYICFVDSDDELDIHYVEVLHDAIVTYDVPLAICSYDTRDVEGQSEKFQFPDKETVTAEKMMFSIMADEYIHNYVNRKESSVTAWTRMYSRELAQRVLFPEGKVYEDMATHIQFVTDAGKIAVVKETLYYYYKNRKGSIVDTITTQNMKDYLWARQTMYNQIVAHNGELSEKAKWIVNEASLSIMINIYKNQGRDGEKLVEHEYLCELKTEIKNSVFYRKYDNLYTYLKAFLVLCMPYLFPIIEKIGVFFKGRSETDQ